MDTACVTLDILSPVYLAEEFLTLTLQKTIGHVAPAMTLNGYRLTPELTLVPIDEALGSGELLERDLVEDDFALLRFAAIEVSMSLTGMIGDLPLHPHSIAPSEFVPFAYHSVLLC